MPLHLLPKKSWNVYSPANIARVRADEARAQAEEESLAQQRRVADADRRLRILRGEPEPEAEPQVGGTTSTQPRPERTPEEAAVARTTAKEKRSLKRRRDEDDTEHALRLARQDLTSPAATAADPHRRPKPHGHSSKHPDAPITDSAGHINLFPAPGKPIRRNGEAEPRPPPQQQQRTEGQTDGQIANHHHSLKNDASGTSPWYTTTTASSSHLDNAYSGPFGLKDGEEGRERRAQKRLGAEDPLAMMKKGAKRVKGVREGRERWRKGRERDVGGSIGVDDGFRLDGRAGARGGPQGEDRDIERRRERRSGSHRLDIPRGKEVEDWYERRRRGKATDEPEQEYRRQRKSREERY